MSRTVELVLIAEVRPLLVRLSQSVVAVEVPVLLLGAGDPGDYLVHLPIQLFVRVARQRVGGAFEHLVDVGVVEVYNSEIALD